MNKVSINKFIKKPPKKKREREQLRTTIHKRDLLKALIKHKGLVSFACADAHLTTKVYYEYFHNDPVFRAKVEAIGESVLDFSESKLHELIKDKEPSAIYFHLKCKGKKRGYIERQDVGIFKAPKTPLNDEEKAAIADFLDERNGNSNKRTNKKSNRRRA